MEQTKIHHDKEILEICTQSNNTGNNHYVKVDWRVSLELTQAIALDPWKSNIIDHNKFTSDEEDGGLE